MAGTQQDPSTQVIAAGLALEGIAAVFVAIAQMGEFINQQSGGKLSVVQTAFTFFSMAAMAVGVAQEMIEKGHIEKAAKAPTSNPLPSTHQETIQQMIHNQHVNAEAALGS